MSERDRHNRDKNTFARRQARKRMKENLSKGLNYGTGFFHPTKNDIKESHHGSRYK